MSYQDKMPTVNVGPAGVPVSYPMPRPIAPHSVNHRIVPGKVPGAPRCALMDKVREFESADQLRAMGLYPYFRVISSAQDTEVLINGKKVLMLGSNSYLGLTNHPKIKEAAQRGRREVWHRVRGVAFSQRHPGNSP